MMQKYTIIANDMRKKILEGVYKANDQLPFEKDLCTHYDTSKMTVKKALDILVSEGLIIKRRGAGTFVKDLSVEDMKSLLISSQMIGTTAYYPDKKVTSQVLEFSIQPASQSIAEKLNISQDTFIYNIYRVRQIDGVPKVIERTYMPVDVIPGLRLEHVEESIYSYIIGDLGLKIHNAHRKISVRKATSEEENYLNIPSGDPVAITEQIGYLSTGVAFEYSITVHTQDSFNLEVVLTHN